MLICVSNYGRNFVSFYMSCIFHKKGKKREFMQTSLPTKSLGYIPAFSSSEIHWFLLSFLQSNFIPFFLFLPFFLSFLVLSSYISFSPHFHPPILSSLFPFIICGPFYQPSCAPSSGPSTIFHFSSFRNPLNELGLQSKKTKKSGGPMRMNFALSSSRFSDEIILNIKVFYNLTRFMVFVMKRLRDFGSSFIRCRVANTLRMTYFIITIIFLVVIKT